MTRTNTYSEHATIIVYLLVIFKWQTQQVLPHNLVSEITKELLDIKVTAYALLDIKVTAYALYYNQGKPWANYITGKIPDKI